MNEHGKDEKIEKLDLNDIDLEVKIQPTEVNIENLDFEMDSNTNDKNHGTTENLPDNQLSSENLQNNQLQQSDNLVENEGLENSYNEENLNGPEAEEKNDEQSSGENLSDDKTEGASPTNDKTTSENSSGNKEGEKPQNNNSENKKNGNDLSNDNPENKKDVNKDSGEKNNHDNGQKKSDSNNKKDQDTNKTPQDNKNKKENSSPSKPNNNKSETGPKEKKQNGLKKKRDDLKNKWNNRPKTPKDFANRAKNGIKNHAKNRYNNSRLGKTINGGKKAIENSKKVAQKTKVAAKTVGAFLKTPAGLITLGVIAGLLLILVIVVMVPSMFASGSPQIGGEVQDEENYSKYSEVDQKTIDKLKTISEKYASGNPSYAMAATLYPYIEEMQNGNVNSIRGKTNNPQSDDDVYDDDDNNSDKSDNEDNNSDKSDNEDLEESKNDTTSNDPYLELFRKRKYRKKFEKLLEISKDGDDALTDFLKKTWFTADAGYKELFDGVKDEDALANAIINDIQDQKDDFKGYFYDNCSTSYSTQSAGSVDFDEMLKGNILVDVKVSSCTTGKDVWNCESMYDTPIDMAKYVKGVTYEEIGVSGSSDVEKVKAQMVAAKSYVIGRSKSMGWGVREDSNGNYVITIRANTNDQDYCDIDVGCKSGKTEVRSGSRTRDAVDDATRAKLDEAWEATKNVYIQNSDGALKGEFCNSRSSECNFCTKGSCMAHQELEKYESVSYDKILVDQYSSYALVTVEGDFASAVVGTSSTSCDTEGGYGIPDDKFKFYYQTNYPNINFCGATDYTNGCPPSGKNTICTSGCGVTSYAMIVATLSQDENDFDPIKANEEATQSNSCVVGGGTKNTLFTGILNHHSGFSFENIPTTLDGASQVLSVLKKGGVVAANVQSLSPFTTGGHWIIIRGVTTDGKVKVADPNSENRSITDSYNIDDFISKNWLVDESGTKHQWYGIYGPKSNEFKTLGDATVTGKLTYPIEGNKGNWSLGTIKSSDHLRYSNGNYHGGNDISVSKGTTVLAMDGGEVIAADDTTNKGKDVVSEGYGHFGKFVSIKHEIDGKTYYSVYAHLDSISVNVGDKVSQGQEIGKSGNTGNSSGPHLHVAFSYNAYSYGSGAPIYNKNVIAPYIYITGSKKGQSYTSDVGSNY